MPRVKENIIKIKVLAALKRVTFCSITEGQLIDGLLSVMVKYLSMDMLLMDNV